jgi:hypothetical protein
VHFRLQSSIFIVNLAQSGSGLTFSVERDHTGDKLSRRKAIVRIYINDERNCVPVASLTYKLTSSSMQQGFCPLLHENTFDGTFLIGFGRLVKTAAHG